MPEFITVAKYHDSDPKVLLLRSRLEAEGIACFIKNEFVVYTKGSRPPELQIRESDLEMAMPILHEMGFYIPEEDQEHYNSLFQKFDLKTAEIPFLKNFKMETRLLIITLLVVGTLSTICYFALQPTLADRLEKNSWCVQKIIYKGRYVPVRSTEAIQLSMNGCTETIRFRNDGRIDLPGINTFKISGQWGEYKKRLIISEVGENGKIYNGEYEILFSDNQSIILHSASTTIFLERLPWPF